MTKSLVAWKPVTPSTAVASARLRAYLPCEYMRRAGWSCEMFDSSRVDRYRAVVFQKSYDDASLELVEKLRKRGAKTVFDLCDNHFFHESDPARAEQVERLRRMVALVDRVSVSTPQLGALIERDTTTVIDDVLELPTGGRLMRWLGSARRASTRAAPTLRVVWFGNAGTDNPAFGLVDLPRVLPALAALHARMPVSLTVISNSRTLFRRYVQNVPFAVRYVPWHRRTFAAHFALHDLCVIPVTSNPFTVCKTNNRLALSLLMGVPAIVDPIPSYAEFAPYVLFSDWERSLLRYGTDGDLRREHARCGGAYVRAKYTRSRVVEQWSGLLEPLLAD